MASTLLPKKIPGMKLLRNLAVKWYRTMGKLSKKLPMLTTGLMGASLGAGIAGTLSPKREKLRNMLLAAGAGGLTGAGVGKFILKPGATETAMRAVRRNIMKNFEFAPIGMALTPTPISAGAVLPAYLGAKSGVKAALRNSLTRNLLGGLAGGAAVSPFAIRQFKEGETIPGIATLIGGTGLGIAGTDILYNLARRGGR